MTGKIDKKRRESGRQNDRDIVLAQCQRLYPKTFIIARKKSREKDDKVRHKMKDSERDYSHPIPKTSFKDFHDWAEKESRERQESETQMKDSKRDYFQLILRTLSSNLSWVSGKKESRERRKKENDTGLF